MAPTHPPLARASLDSSKHPSVNVFLKSLKLNTRTLSALFAQHATELAVLERLYYLNNNQHRPALFWQRVVEARRYSRRLRSLDVSSLVDGLRRSFYGDVTDASSKPQKGAWTHYPSVPSLKSFLSRLEACTALLDKTCVRMRAIYQMLTLAMQSGAFLQLVVTLTALVARLAHLSSGIRSVLSTLHAESMLLLSALHPMEASRHLAPMRPPPPPLEGEDTNTFNLPPELSKHPVPDDDLDISVDLGEAVARTPALTPQPKSRLSSPMLLDHLSPIPDAKFAPVVRPRQLCATVDIAPLASAPGSSSRQAVMVRSRTAPLARPTAHNTVTAAEEPKKNKRKKAKKMKRDEIDDIFS